MSLFGFRTVSSDPHVSRLQNQIESLLDRVQSLERELREKPIAEKLIEEYKKLGGIYSLVYSTTLGRIRSYANGRPVFSHCTNSPIHSYEIDATPDDFECQVLCGMRKEKLEKIEAEELVEQSTSYWTLSTDGSLRVTDEIADVSRHGPITQTNKSSNNKKRKGKGK